MDWNKLVFNMTRAARGSKLATVTEVLFEIDMKLSDAKKMVDNETLTCQVAIKEILTENERNMKLYFWGDVCSMSS